MESRGYAAPPPRAAKGDQTPKKSRTPRSARQLIATAREWLEFIAEQDEDGDGEYPDEDGYTGTLTPDYPGIKVEAKGYQTSSRTVTATRSDPNLSDADTSLILRTIQDSGRTLTLAEPAAYFTPY